MLLLSSSQTSCLLGWARSDIVWQVYRYVRARGDSCKLFTGWSKWIFPWNWWIYIRSYPYILTSSTSLRLHAWQILQFLIQNPDGPPCTAAPFLPLSQRSLVIFRDSFVLLPLSCFIWNPRTPRSRTWSLPYVRTWRTCGGHRNDDFFGIWNVLCGLSREIEPMRRCQICT